MYQKAGIILPAANGKALHDLAKAGSYEKHEAQANGHQAEQEQVPLTLEAVQKRAVATGVAKSRKDWQFFNAETFGEFVPDEKLKGDQKRLILLNDEITARGAKAGK